MVPNDKYNTRQTHGHSPPKGADLHRFGERRWAFLIETHNNHKDVFEDQDADKERDIIVSKLMHKTSEFQNDETPRPATIEKSMNEPQNALILTAFMRHFRQCPPKNYIIPDSDVLGFKKDNRMSHNLRNNALKICNTNDAKSYDNGFLNCDWRDNATQRSQREDQPQSDLLKEEQWVVIKLHPNKRSWQGQKHREEHRDSTSTGQGQICMHPEGMPNKTFDQFTFIRLPKREGDESATKIRDRIADWRAQVVISGSPSHPDQAVGESSINKSYQNTIPLVEGQDQHSSEQRMTVLGACHDDDEDQEYRARLNKAYRKNFCEETADLFSGTMEAGRWDDIVTQLNFPKSKADQLFSDSVTALKQKASEAYDSHPHHASPPETLFRLQEVLVREAVLALAKQCREQNGASPQSFEKNK